MMAFLGALKGSRGISNVVGRFFRSPLLAVFVISMALWVTFLPVSSGGLGLVGNANIVSQYYEAKIPMDRLFPSVNVNGVTFRYLDVWFYLKNFAESIQGPSTLLRTSTNNLLGAFSALISRFADGSGWNAILGVLFFGFNVLITLVNFVILVVQVVTFPFFFILRAFMLVLSDGAWNGYLNFLSFQIPYL